MFIQKKNKEKNTGANVVGLVGVVNVLFQSVVVKFEPEPGRVVDLVVVVVGGGVIIL